MIQLLSKSSGRKTINYSIHSNPEKKKQEKKISKTKIFIDNKVFYAINLYFLTLLFYYTIIL